MDWDQECGTYHVFITREEAPLPTLVVELVAANLYS